MAKTQTIRLTKAEIVQQRDMQVRGEALGMAFQFASAAKFGMDDTIRAAEKIYAFLKDRKVPAEATIELARPNAAQ